MECVNNGVAGNLGFRPDCAASLGYTQYLYIFDIHPASFHLAMADTANRLGLLEMKTVCSSSSKQSLPVQNSVVVYDV